ncbi:MAG: ABC transporter permease [Bacillota bacterium]
MNTPIYPSDMFQRVKIDASLAQTGIRPSDTFWQSAWQHLKRNRLAMFGLVVIAFLVLMAIIGPWLTSHTYFDQSLSLKDQPPSSQYWFGTDALGRDLFTRVWYGARISLSIGLFVALVCSAFGVLYGGISGLLGGWVDEMMMRVVEVLSVIPFLLYVILLMMIMEPGLKTIVVALGVVYWLPMARLVRGQILSLKEQEYVLAARVMGASQWRMLIRHLLPNTMGPIIVFMTLTIPEAIFTEAFLSFIGLGVSAPIASWGTLASEGIKGIRSYPWQLLFPALFISFRTLDMI